MVELVRDALAVYRLWRLLAEDTILDGPRDRWEAWVYERHGRTDPGHTTPVPKLITLLGCPWCLGFWLTIGAAICRAAAPRSWDRAANVLALSALVGGLANLVSAIEAHAD